MSQVATGALKEKSWMMKMLSGISEDGVWVINGSQIQSYKKKQMKRKRQYPIKLCFRQRK